MTINENTNFPEINFFKISESGPIKLKSSELFGEKKILLVGVPGAFTPTCSDDHLPGYIKCVRDFEDKGVEKIIFVCNNDPFVVKSWSEKYKNSGIDFISDGNGEFRSKSGLEIDLSSVGLGKRLSRFTMLIEKGVIKKIFNENGPGLDVSEAQKVLDSI